MGFSWGFSIHNATFTYEAPAALAPSVWDGHRAVLAREHPSWGFADGYRSHSSTLPRRSDRVAQASFPGPGVNSFQFPSETTSTAPSATLMAV